MSTKPIYQNSLSDVSSFVQREASATIPVSNPSAAKTSSKQDADDKAKDKVTKMLASLSQPNAANRPYGAGDTIASTGVAYKTVVQVNVSSGKGQAAGETTFLEARARTYQTKTAYGAEGQAGLFRTEYGAKWDSALAQTGSHELFGLGGQVKGEGFIGAQVNAQAGAGMKGVLPAAQASASAFAGARAVIAAGGEVRVLGLGLRANGTAQAWAGAEGSAAVSASPVGVSAEVEGFAGAAASAQGSASFAGIGVTGEADAYAGAGGKAGVTVGYKNGEIKVEAELGAALGLGAGGDVGVSVNLDQLLGDGEAFLGTAGALWNDATANGGVVSDVVNGAEGVVTDAGNVLGGLAQGAGQAADAVAGFFGF